MKRAWRESALYSGPQRYEAHISHSSHILLLFRIPDAYRLMVDAHWNFQSESDLKTTQAKKVWVIDISPGKPSVKYRRENRIKRDDPPTGRANSNYKLEIG